MSFRVSAMTDAGVDGSLHFATNDAPSINAPGTAVIGSGANMSATPALRRVFETEFGLTTLFNPAFVLLSARQAATTARSFMIRVAELALDLKTCARCWLSLIDAEMVQGAAYSARGQQALAT